MRMLSKIPHRGNSVCRFALSGACSMTYGIHYPLVINHIK